jgi:hypothetical protein
MLDVIMLSVTLSYCYSKRLCGECHYAECRGANHFGVQVKKNFFFLRGETK